MDGAGDSRAGRTGSPRGRLAHTRQPDVGAEAVTLEPREGGRADTGEGRRGPAAAAVPTAWAHSVRRGRGGQPREEGDEPGGSPGAAGDGRSGL